MESPKDDHAAERQIRGPVRWTRKTPAAPANGDTARNAAVIWTVTATAQIAGLNVLTYLTAYLDECGRNGGKPLAGRALERFLPSNTQPRRPPHLGTAATPRIKPARITTGTGWLPRAATPALSMPFHRTSEYLRTIEPARETVLLCTATPCPGSLACSIPPSH